MDRSAVPPPVTAVIDAAGAWLPRRMAEVEKRLAEVTTGHGAALAGEAAETLEAGGKRMRPMLVLVCAGERGGEAALRSAVAVELVHMATLVHDDVLDAAPVRRGRPTVVARSGRERATAVGDLLFSRAFAELSVDGSERQTQILSASCVDLALGELAQRRDAYDIEVTEKRYLERCRLKTAGLFESACRLGRVAAGAAGEDQLAEFGREIGLAFQLLDDVLDVVGPEARTGKARGTDLLDGTVTLPLIVARDRDADLADLDLRSLDPSAAVSVCDRIAATAAPDEVRRRARDAVQRAKSGLADGPFTPEECDLLGLVADGVVERYS